MSLRDTLNAAAQRRDQEAAHERNRPQIIRDWKATISTFYETIRGWLAPYEQDNSISFHEIVEQITEEGLGTYEAAALDMRAGEYVVSIRPVGKYIIGAQGRIDMFRQGRSSDGTTVRFLRIGEPANGRWLIRKPQVQWIGSAVVANPSDAIPLTREVFEAALDELLQ